MSLLVAVVAALGLVLVYVGITSPTATSRPRWRIRLDNVAHESGFRGLTAPRLIAGLVLVWLLSFLLAAGITQSIVVSATLACGALWLPMNLLRSRRAKRRRRFAEAWPDAIATLVAAVRAGVSLPEACVGLTVRGPVELAGGFNAFAATYRATGSLDAGLRRLRDELRDPIADRVAVALALAHEVGGTDLVRVLRTLGDFVREDIRVRKEIEARWSWTVTAARVAAAAPWAILLMMSTRPEAAAAYDSSAGAIVILVGAAATLLGYRLMLRAARLPEEPRLPL